MPERLISVRVDVHVVTNKSELRRRVDLAENETGAQLVERVRDALHEIDGYPGSLTSERRFMQVARLVAEHWRAQEGINASYLDELVRVYEHMTKEERNGNDE